MCGHRFCRHCITPFRDCPICGADCQPLSEDADMQGGCMRHTCIFGTLHTGMYVQPLLLPLPLLQHGGWAVPTSTLSF